MQHLNDDELLALLRKWDAPGAPSGMEDRVVAAAGFSRVRRWLQWLMMGTIRVPAPVGIGVAIVLLLLALQVVRPTKPVGSGFDGFQPVQELKPRLIRSTYDSN